MTTAPSLEEMSPKQRAAAYTTLSRVAAGLQPANPRTRELDEQFQASLRAADAGQLGAVAERVAHIAQPITEDEPLPVAVEVEPITPDMAPDALRLALAARVPIRGARRLVPVEVPAT